MTRRWLALMGRIGSILLTSGLTLALVSLIPPAPIGTRGAGWILVEPESYAGTGFGVHTPRTGFHISVTSNNSVQFYILGEFPELDERKPSLLEAYLQAHQEEVFFSGTVENELSLDFFPPRMTEVCLVYSNPSPTWVNVTKTYTHETILISKGQILMPTVVLIISGGVLMIPSLARRNKEHR